MTHNSIEVVETYNIPTDPQSNTVYRILPQSPSHGFYDERTNRNIGWITKEEQAALRETTIAIAGCGGMGGLAAEKLLRLGVGVLRIADPEDFDTSNINRQFAATRSTIGRSKAFETARMMREIADDTIIEVFPQGIEPHGLARFLKGAAVVVDEIEFWNIGSCVLLHQAARAYKIPILNALTVGFAAYLHRFTPESAAVEDMLDMSLEVALKLELRVTLGTITRDERQRIMDSALRCFVPKFPHYYSGKDAELNESLVMKRLLYEGRAPIIATNPPFAGGLVADHALLCVLDQLGLAERSFGQIPATPGYLKIDAATLTLDLVKTREY